MKTANSNLATYLSKSFIDGLIVNEREQVALRNLSKTQIGICLSLRSGVGFLGVFVYSGFVFDSNKVQGREMLNQAKKQHQCPCGVC